MGYSVRRWRDELRSIEKQLPLYHQKISELEKRQKELKSLLEEEDKGKEKEKPSAAAVTEPVKRRYAQLSLAGPRTYAEHEPVKPSAPVKEALPLAVLAKDNVIGILGDVNSKLRFLNQVVYKAVSNVETLMVIINFLEQSGGDLQNQLMSIAEQVRAQMENPISASTASEDGNDPAQLSSSRLDNLNITPEMISEIMKSPLFHQLAAQFAPESRQ